MHTVVKDRRNRNVSKNVYSPILWIPETLHICVCVHVFVACGACGAGAAVNAGVTPICASPGDNLGDFNRMVLLPLELYPLVSDTEILFTCLDSSQRTDNCDSPQGVPSPLPTMKDTGIQSAHENVSVLFSVSGRIPRHPGFSLSLARRDCGEQGAREERFLGTASRARSTACTPGAPLPSPG